jgi:hypothetical protein
VGGCIPAQWFVVEEKSGVLLGMARLTIGIEEQAGRGFLSFGFSFNLSFLSVIARYPLSDVRSMSFTVVC